MPKKIPAKPRASIFILPFELCKDVVRSIAFCVLYRPVFCMFVCTSITVIYLILSSQKVQRTLASLPYERFIAHFKSQRMITVYATVVEVVLELLMAVVLAGVSVIITMWLVFEEMADRKNVSLSDRLYVNCNKALQNFSKMRQKSTDELNRIIETEMSSVATINVDQFANFHKESKQKTSSNDLVSLRN